MLFPKSKFLFFFLALVSFLFYSSCATDNDPLTKYGTFVKSVMRSESGAFRGFNLGDTPDSVSLKEVSKPMDSDSSFLYYEYAIDSSGSYNITYNFDETGLSEIQSYIYIKNAAQIDTVFASFKSYFDLHYGASQQDMGYNVWAVKSEKFGDIKINLQDESAELTVDGSPGKISLSIYPDKD